MELMTKNPSLNGVRIRPMAVRMSHPPSPVGPSELTVVRGERTGIVAGAVWAEYVDIIPMVFPLSLRAPIPAYPRALSLSCVNCRRLYRGRTRRVCDGEHD